MNEKPLAGRTTKTTAGYMKGEPLETSQGAKSKWVKSLPESCSSHIGARHFKNAKVNNPGWGRQGELLF